MIGDDKKRFCLGCKKDVYNLSAMSKSNANRLVANNAGKICVRYAKSPSGKVFTIDQKLHQISRRTSTIAASVIATTLTFSASAYSQACPIKSKSGEKETVTQVENNTSQIAFVAYDQINVVIPDAKATLIKEKTKKKYVAETNQSFLIQFSSIPKGKYEIEVSAPGFKTESKAIEITQKVEPTQNIILEIGYVGIVGDFTISQYETPFFDAIVRQDKKRLKKFIEEGFDVNTKNKNGVTALHVAMQMEDLKTTKLLVQNKANINAQDKEGKTPLMFMEEFDTQTPIVKYLVSKGANVNIQDKQGKTPLMYAVDDEIENLEAVKIFLKSGAIIETRDKKGNTALMIASDGFSEEIVNELLKSGANPNVKNKRGETPLSLAKGKKGTLDILRRYGAIK